MSVRTIIDIIAFNRIIWNSSPGNRSFESAAKGSVLFVRCAKSCAWRLFCLWNFNRMKASDQLVIKLFEPCQWLQTVNIPEANSQNSQ